MRTAHNVVANVGGRLWQVLMSFAFIPLYIRFMGVEAYGLVAVFTTMLAVFSVLDMGLSLAVNRELARLSAAGDLGWARSLTRTLEVVYWLIGAVIAVIIFFGAGAITHHWLNLSRMPVATATLAVQLMAGVALLRWPGALYTGVLMGLRRHVALNLITILFSTLSGAGALLVLWLVSPSVTAFFAWQIAAAAIQIVLLAVTAWRKLAGPGAPARFDPAVLRTIYRFSAGVFGVTLLSVVLMQLDKLVLSSTLSLTAFGYYSLAFTVGSVLSTIGLSIHGALFPPLSHHAAASSEAQIASFYHKSCQVMAVAIVPAGTTLAFFAPDLLLLYLHDPAIVANVQGLVIIFAIANTMFALLMIPYALQLAFGWTRLSIVKNVIAIAIYIPTLLLMVRSYGTIGAACTWLALMCGYFILEIRIMHRRLLVNQMGNWYLRDVLVPVLLSVAIIGAARLAAGPWMALPLRFALSVIGAGVATIAIVAASPDLRRAAIGTASKLRYSFARRPRSDRV